MGFFPRRVGQDDSARSFLLGIEPFDNYVIAHWHNLHADATFVFGSVELFSGS
jgi:hypothetical protein